MKTTSYIIFSIVGLYLAFVGFFILYGIFVEDPNYNPNRQYINLSDNPVQKQFDAEVHTIRLLSTDGEQPEEGMNFAYMSKFPGVWITCDEFADNTIVEYSGGWGDNIKSSYADGVLTLEISTQFPADKYRSALEDDPLPIKITGVRGFVNLENGLDSWGMPSIEHIKAEEFNIYCLAGNYFRYCDIGTLNIMKYENEANINESSSLKFKDDTDIDRVNIIDNFTKYLTVLTDSTSVVRSLEWKQPAECENVRITVEGSNLMQMLVSKEK